MAAIAMEFLSCFRVPQVDFAVGVARQDAASIRREDCGIDVAAVAGIASQLDATGHVPKPHKFVSSSVNAISRRARDCAVHVGMGVEVDRFSGCHVPEAGSGLEAAAESPLSILRERHHVHVDVTMVNVEELEILPGLEIRVPRGTVWEFVLQGNVCNVWVHTNGQNRRGVRMVTRERRQSIAICRPARRNALRPKSGNRGYKG